MTIPAEALIPQDNSTPNLPAVSAGGWFTYEESTKEFGVDMLPRKFSLGSKLGHAIITGLEWHDISYFAEASERAPSDIDTLTDDQGETTYITTTSPRTLYEALYMAQNLGIDPDIRSMLDKILGDLVDFTRVLATEGVGAPDQQNSFLYYDAV